MTKNYEQLLHGADSPCTMENHTLTQRLKMLMMVVALMVIGAGNMWGDTYTWDLETWGKNNPTQGKKDELLAPQIYTVSDCDLTIQLSKSTNDKISSSGVFFNGASKTESSTNVRCLYFTAPKNGTLTITYSSTTTSKYAYIGTTFNATSSGAYVARGKSSDSPISCSVVSGGTYYIYCDGSMTFTKVELVSTGLVDPTITTTNKSIGVDNTLDLSTMFDSNSNGAKSYSVTGATASDYTLSGSDFTPSVAGNYTIQLSQAAVDGLYNAATATATVTVKENQTITASSPEGGTYTVQIGDAAAQTITAQTSLSTIEGTTITMTSTATDGYKVGSTPFTVKDADGTSVSVSKSGSNYSFTMPAKAVTISASFFKTYSITAADCSNGSITITDKSGTEITSTSKGSDVYVTASPNTGYLLTELYYVREGDETETHNAITSGTAFSMVASNITVHATFEKAPGTKIIGGDLSLVPAYETAGDKWKDASGNEISDLVTYVKETCGWNAVRVRLFVEPDNDSYLATCQDIDYVKSLGKRIKDAGMYFLLDIHYSDTWADVSNQWIPTSWGMSDETKTSKLAKKAYEYTKETLESLVANGAAPDYVQVGNEVSYGMLWDNSTDKSTGNAAYLPYSDRTAQWACFATLFRNGAKAVRKVCPNAKIILHSERTADETKSQAIYDNIITGGLDAADFDIIGLSYYPFWHGTLSQLGTTINTLQTAYPSKEIQIVETAWLNGKSSYPSSATYTSDNFTWAQTPAGQKAYIDDLIATLDDYSNVSGLYYYQPEECGNGANSAGTNKVMDSWDGRGFWDISWKSSSHSLISSDAIMALANQESFSPKAYSEIEEVENTDFVNLDFEYGSAAGWTYDQALSTQDVDEYDDSWMGSDCGGDYVMTLWNSSAASGSVISQSATIANGTYVVTVSGYSKVADAYYLFADDQTVSLPTTAGTVQVEVIVTDGNLNIGIGANSSVSGDLYCYFDNFTITRKQITVDGIIYAVDGTNLSVSGTTSDLSADVVIPSTITYGGTTYNVTSIADDAFKDNTTVNSIRTANSITSVGDNAFSGCTYLHYVCLGSGVTSIGDNAFKDCSGLNVIVLNSENAITYGDTPFDGVSTSAARLYLSSTLYDSKSTYTGYGFSDGSATGTTNNIAKTAVENGVIYGLWDDMTASVAGYTEDLAAQTRIPSTLHFDEDTYVPCTQYFMTQIEQFAFAKATVLTNVTVCNNTYNIGMCAFRNCTALTDVTFGEDMYKFYDRVFENDANLQKVTLYSNNFTEHTGYHWGYNSKTPLNELTQSITLYSPYSASDAETAYTGFGAYTQLTVGTNGDTTYDINNLTLRQEETTISPEDKLTADAASKYSAQYVTINRGLTASSSDANQYYTIVLPWDLSATEVTALGFTPYYLADGTWYYNGIYHINCTESTTMQGGVPYLIKMNTTTSCGSAISLGLEFTTEYRDIVKPSKDRKSDDGTAIQTVQFYGSYLHKDVPEGSYVIKDNELHKTEAENGAYSVYMDGYRAYFGLNGTLDPQAEAIRIVFDINNEETGITTLDAETLQPVEKEGIYDLSGRKLNSVPATRGIYVVNGKKIVINQK